MSEEEQLRRYPSPPEGLFRSLGEAALGLLVEAGAVYLHPPDVIAVPVLIIGGAAVIHGIFKAARSTW